MIKNRTVRKFRTVMTVLIFMTVLLENRELSGHPLIG